VNSIADQLITRGWSRGQLVAEDGSVCLAGAVQLAVREHVELWQPWTDEELSSLNRGMLLVAELVRPSLAHVFTPVTDSESVIGALNAHSHLISLWNDKVCADADEAIRVAKRADEILDAR